MWSVAGHDVKASCCRCELCSGDVDLAWCRRSRAGIARRSACGDDGARGTPECLSSSRSSFRQMRVVLADLLLSRLCVASPLLGSVFDRGVVHTACFGYGAR